MQYDMKDEQQAVRNGCFPLVVVLVWVELVLYAEKCDKSNQVKQAHLSFTVQIDLPILLNNKAMCFLLSSESEPDSRHFCSLKRLRLCPHLLSFRTMSQPVV